MSPKASKEEEQRGNAPKHPPQQRRGREGPLLGGKPQHPAPPGLQRSFPGRWPLKPCRHFLQDAVGESPRSAVPRAGAISRACCLHKTRGRRQQAAAGRGRQAPHSMGNWLVNHWFSAAVLVSSWGLGCWGAGGAGARCGPGALGGNWGCPGSVCQPWRNKYPLGLCAVPRVAEGWLWVPSEGNRE